MTFAVTAIKTLLPTLLLATASQAHAAPFGGADCAVTEGENLGGQALTLSHADDPFKTTATLAFSPKSFYVADGYAIKMFAGANFTGDGDIGGTASDLANGTLKSADGGGHFFNLGYLRFGTSRVVGSVACVPAGKLMSNLLGFRFGRDKHYEGRPAAITFYPGLKIATTGHGYHETSAFLTVTDTDGKRLLNFTEHFPVGGGLEGTVDLDTGTIVVKSFAVNYPHDLESEQTINRDRSIVGYDFAYQGAIGMVLNVVKLVLENPAGGGPGGNPETVSNLELTSLLEALQYGR